MNTRAVTTTVLVSAILFASACSSGSDTQATTTVAAPEETAPDTTSGPRTAAELTEVVAAAPAPPNAVCVATSDLTSEGDVTQMVRATYDDASGALVGQITLQETESDFTDTILADLVRRNSLDLDFPAIDGAKTRATSGTAGSPTDGTPVAFRTGDSVVILSVTVGAEGGLAGWAPAVDAYLSDQEPVAAPAPLPPC